MKRPTIVTLLAALFVSAASASAQAIGTFHWQLQPYCNVVSVAVTQSGGVFRLDGTDDLCGGALDRASVVGTAFPNPDGTIGFGLTIITPPGGYPVHVDASIQLSTLSGTWRDSQGAAGAFAFTPGAGTGGSPRPAGTNPLGGVLPDGGFVARGDFSAGAIPASGEGTRMMWYPGKAALRAGTVGSTRWNDANVGPFSTAFGADTIASAAASMAFGYEAVATGTGAVAGGVFTLASGEHSTAFGAFSKATGRASLSVGELTEARGAHSVAFGGQTLAIGDASLAAGFGATANGDQSVALGKSTQATGAHAVAIGHNTTASLDNSFAAGAQSGAAGFESIAMGLRVTAGGNGAVALGTYATGHEGSFVFGDRSSQLHGLTNAANQFAVRAVGGVKFFTSSDLTKNCAINSSASLQCTGGVVTSSDRNRKRAITPLDGEVVLRKISGMPVTTWSFIDAPGVRHAGPMAQDFRAAFGLGENDTTIGYTDINGINMRAIQALESRTRDLRDENAVLRERLARLEQLLLEKK